MPSRVKVCFYVMGEKGLEVLKNFTRNFDSRHILYVVSAKDPSLENDFYSEVKEVCRDNKIAFFDKKESHPIVDSSVFCFAIAWRWIIHDCKKLIVLHDSLLPKYRGFAPLVNMLVNGEREIGVTALLASEEYDKGDILGQASIEVKYPMKISTAISEISKLYSSLIVDIFTKIVNGVPLESHTQNETDASYSLWLDQEDYRVNWCWSADKIKRFVDAVGYPYGRAETILDERILKIDDVEVFHDVDIEDRDRHVGKVIFMKDGKPIVICGQGLLLLSSVDLTSSGISHINFRSRFK